MPDITMCQDRTCNKFKDCYRAQAKPTIFWQSYFVGSPRQKETGKCDYFWPFEVVKNATDSPDN